MSYRGSFQIGSTVNLRTVFTDPNNNFIDADAAPIVYLYDDSVDDETRQAEIDAGTFTSAVESLPATALATGYYGVSYTVAVAEGLVYEIWAATVDGAAQTTQFTWTATAGATVESQILGNNMMLIIEIDGLADADGNKLKDELFFTTMYSPMYASPDMLRMELGTLVEDIPDDTLALMIHWSSKEADFIQVLPGCNRARLEFARTKYVMYDAAIRAFLVTESTARTSGDKKSLGNLSISHGGSSGGGFGGDLLNRLRAARDEWFRVLNAGGCITPGQGYAPAVAVKGRYDPDRRVGGRLWEDPREFPYSEPSTNQKRVRPSRRRGRFGHYPVSPSPYERWIRDE